MVVSSKSRTVSVFFEHVSRWINSIRWLLRRVPLPVFGVLPGGVVVPRDTHEEKPPTLIAGAC